MEPRDDAILRISTLENGKKRLSCKKKCQDESHTTHAKILKTILNGVKR